LLTVVKILQGCKPLKETFLLFDIYKFFIIMFSVMEQ